MLAGGEVDKLRGQLQRLKAQMVSAAAEREEEGQQRTAVAQAEAARMQAAAAALQDQLQRRGAEAAGERQEVRPGRRHHPTPGISFLCRV